MTASAGADDRHHLRIMCWNVRGLQDDVDALSATIQDVSPDILLVQETPLYVLPRQRIDRLGAPSSLRVLTGARPGRGLAILGTERIARAVIGHSLQSVHVTMALDRPSTWTPRGIAAIRLGLADGSQLVVADVHLALREDDRMGHVRRLLGLVAGAGAPVIVGGDMNEHAGGQARAELGSVLHDALAPQEEWTFPARAPRSRIDAFYLSDGVRALDCRRITSTQHVSPERVAGATDHLPLVLDVAIPGI